MNMNGELIGINSAKLASTEVEGMGYAIPISQVSEIIEKLMNETTRSKVSQEEKAVLGITGLSVTQEIHTVYGIPSGVYITSVTPDGAAAQAGIAQGDVVTSFDGKKITGINILEELLEYYKAGETVEVTVQTAGENGYTEKTMSLVLGGNSITGQNLYAKI